MSSSFCTNSQSACDTRKLKSIQCAVKHPTSCLPWYKCHSMPLLPILKVLVFSSVRLNECTTCGSHMVTAPVDTWWLQKSNGLHGTEFLFESWQSLSWSINSPPKSLHLLSLPACYTHVPSHSPWFEQPNNIWRRRGIMKIKRVTQIKKIM
jgi:hypothetical protein